MDTVTYRDAGTIRFINDNLIAMRINSGSIPRWAGNFTIQYTPTIIIVDDEGKERHRMVGFLPPNEFVPFSMLGMAKAAYESGRAKQTKTILSKVVSEYPGTDYARQAGEIQKNLRS